MKAERTFLLSDLLAFAELSGDYNPLHTDPIAARRTHFGDCVAHGVFVLLWALDSLQGSITTKHPWKRINAKFLRPVISGMRVEASSVENGPGHYSLTIKDQGRVLLHADVFFDVVREQAVNEIWVKDCLPPREVPQATQTSNFSKVAQNLDLYWAAECGKKTFPRLAEIQTPGALAALLASTRVVGMKIPGEHSIYTQLDLFFPRLPSACEPFTYRVSEFRQSSQRLAIAVEGKLCHGLLWSLVRPAPVVQVGMVQVKQFVEKSRFAGRRVIVVGGSRGLGEIASQVLAAGGAEVAVSYRVGKDDAQHVVQKIVAEGGRAFALRLDTNDPNWQGVLEAKCGQFDHFCYFATPTLTEGDGLTFNAVLFQKFCSVYVEGLINIAQWMAGRNAGKMQLFYASSIAVTNPPLRHLEYAAAKAASETCCHWLLTAHPKANVYIARFPRLLTDQTASFLSSAEQDSLSTVCRELELWLPKAEV